MIKKHDYTDINEKKHLIALLIDVMYGRFCFQKFMFKPKRKRGSIMNYLFFDIEAANRHDSIAKIYSFGYVVANENLEVVEEGEVVINPKADFYFNFEKVHHRIEPPKTKTELEMAEEFPKHYNRIKELLSNNTCIGFGVISDAYMLHESCQRYGLESMRFKYYDLIEIADSLVANRMNGLEALSKQVGIVNTNPHNGHADAYTTYLIFKELKETKNFSIKALVRKSKIFKHTVKKFKVYKEAKKNSRLIPKRVYPDMEIRDEDIESGKAKFEYYRKGGESNG